MQYTKIFSLDRELYADGAPVIVEAGALQRDIERNRTMLQLRFRSLSDQTVKAILIAVRAYDVMGRELQGIQEYQYLDLDMERNGDSGERVLIPMPDPRTRSVDVRCTNVVFAEGSWSDSGAVWTHLPASLDLFTGLPVASAEQYKRETCAAASVMPLRLRGLWRCTCGCINRQDEEACRGCGLGQAVCFDACQSEALEQHAQAYAQEEAEKARLARQQRREAQRIHWLIAAVSALVIFTVLSLTVFYPRARDRKVFDGYSQKAQENFEAYAVRELEDVCTPEAVRAAMETGLQVENVQKTVKNGTYRMTGQYRVLCDGYSVEAYMAVEGSKRTATVQCLAD